MNGRRAKLIRKKLVQGRRRTMRDLGKEMLDSPLRDRLKLACTIIAGRRPWIPTALGTLLGVMTGCTAYAIVDIIRELLT